jgi:PfaB family protein
MVPLSILGVACNLPDASSPEAFWNNLRAGRSSIRNATEQDWGIDPAGVVDPRPGTLDRVSSSAMAGAVTPDLSGEGFCTPIAFAGMGEDLLWPLLVCRDALIDAGLRPDVPKPRCGVILGHYTWAITSQTAALVRPLYDRAIAQALGRAASDIGLTAPPIALDPQAARGGMLSNSIVAALARAFGLGGPAYAIDAACATFAFALKLAARHIESGAADQMIVVAANASDPLFLAYGLSAVRALSVAAQGRPLDARSSGLTPGEGAIAFVVGGSTAGKDKRYGTIRSIGLSSDGRGQHLTAPRPEGQLLACRRAYAEADLDPSTIAFVECHATGTAVGDRAELELLCRLYDGKVPPAGAVKSNIGHLMTASGGAGLLKTLLAMQAGEIPPTTSIGEDLSRTLNVPVHIPGACAPWPRRNGIRRAAINSFGFGGTNAHMIVDDAPAGDAVLPEASRSPAPLAIVGMEACFGPWPDLASFASANLAGTRGYRALPARRWRGFEADRDLLKALALAEGRPPQGGFVESFMFDPIHFRMPPKDVDHLNPQQLLILKVADAALRDAGIAPGGRVAVVVAMAIEYDVHLIGERWSLAGRLQAAAPSARPPDPKFVEGIKDIVRAPPEASDFLAYVGNLMASRISALWDFSGPAFTISGGETGAAQALEIARDLLSSGEADAVLVGAVDLAGGFENFAVRQAIEPNHAEGDPRASFGFDAAHQGWRVGEGAGAIVLKRLQDARQDDAYAVVRGLSIRRPSGATDGDPGTTPCAQAALAEAGLSAADVGYIEATARGTGEIDLAGMNELRAAYAAGADQSIALGSAGALFGHSGVAAGIAGIIRSALAINLAFVPATPDWTKPRPQSGWTRNAFYVPVESQPWLPPGGEAVAAVHVSDPEGASAHVVLASPGSPRKHNLDCARVPFIVPVAGTDAEDLAAKLDEVVRSVQDGRRAEEIEASAVAARMATAPRGLNACLVAPDATALADEAARMARDIAGVVGARRNWRSLRGSYATGAPVGPAGGIAFVYSGMYGAYPGLCRNVLQLVPSLRAEMLGRFGDPGAAMADRLLFPRSLVRLDPAGLEQADERLSEAGAALLRVGVISSFLHTRLLAERFGVRPALALGYSLGEISMLFAADAWELSDAWVDRLSGLEPVLRRLGASDRGDGTSSFVVGASPEAILEAIGVADDVHLSLINSPRECVLVGDPDACERVVRALRADSMQLPARLLLHGPAAMAEHDLLQQCFTAPLGARPPHELRFGGEAVQDWTPSAIGTQIARGLVHRLDFPAAVRSAYADNARMFIEMGPGHSCSRWIDDCLAGQPHAAVAVARRGLDEAAAMAQLAAILVAHGYPIDLEKVIGRRSQLPAPHARVVTLGGEPIPARLAALVRPGEREAVRPAAASSEQPAPVVAGVAEIPAMPVTTGHRDVAIGAAAAAASQSRGHIAFLRQRLALAESLAAPDPAVPDRAHRALPAPAPALYDEADILEVAEGRVANVFGQDFAAIDAMPRRVRVPGQPFTAISRVMQIEGRRGHFDSGRIVTEFDIPRPAWFAVGGSSASQLALDAQGVLFLLSWLGVDLESAGRRRFRWLDANITMTGDYPREGDTLRYDITLTRSFRDGEALMLFFDMNATSGQRPLLQNRNCCVGFFTDEDLARSQGIRPHHRGRRTPPPVPFKAMLTLPERVLGAVDLLALARGDISVLSPAHAGSANPHLRLPPPALHMLDRVIEIDPRGGICGLGRIVAERTLDPSHWAIRAHFKDDAVFPGPCMLEGAVQLLKVFMLASGLHVRVRDARFEPVCSRPYQLRFREQIVPRGQTFVYQTDIVEIGLEPEPYVIADVEFQEAGRTIGRIEGIGLRLATPDAGS